MEMMPILIDRKKRMENPSCPVGISMSMLSESQADTNHGQTLSGLAGRGGLGPCEAIAIIEKRRWEKMELSVAIRALNFLVENHGDTA